jgi:hypothetical protein
MEQQPQQQYLNDIPSLHQTFPDLPNVLGGIDLNIAIQAGAPINPEFRRNAKSVTAIVKDMHGEFLSSIIYFHLISYLLSSCGI